MTKIEIPNPPSPVGNYAAYKITNNLIYISGQLPINKNGEMIKGTIGKDLTLEDGQKAAELCILNNIGQLKNAIKDLDKVVQCVKMNGYINCTSEFIDHPKLLNSASDLLITIFGNRGIHARAVVGTVSLPLNAAVEIETLFEIKK